MAKPKVSTIFLALFSALLTAMAFVCLWAAFSLFTSNPPVMDKGATALGVSGAIALGLWNAWHAWGKERKSESTITAEFGTSYEIVNRFDSPARHPYIACVVRNPGSQPVYIKKITLTSSGPEKLGTESQDFFVDGALWRSGYELDAGRQVQILWHELIAPDAARFGIRKVTIETETGKSLTVRFKDNPV